MEICLISEHLDLKYIFHFKRFSAARADILGPKAPPPANLLKHSKRDFDRKLYHSKQESQFNGDDNVSPRKELTGQLKTNQI